MSEEYNNKEQDISSQILIDSKLKHVPDTRLLLKGLYATDTLSFNGLSWWEVYFSKNTPGGDYLEFTPMSRRKWCLPFQVES